MPPELVVIGASLGGLRALATLLSALPKDFSTPLVIAQHRAKDSSGALSQFLGDYSALRVSEVLDKAPIMSAQVYLAPSDYHILIEAGGFALSTEAPVTAARPSIDVLFESA